MAIEIKFVSSSQKSEIKYMKWYAFPYDSITAFLKLNIHDFGIHSVCVMYGTLVTADISDHFTFVNWRLWWDIFKQHSHIACLAGFIYGQLHVDAVTSTNNRYGASLYLYNLFIFVIN